MHSVAGAVAETRALWCPGNIALSNEAPPPSPGRRNVAPDSGVIQRERIVNESVAPAPVARERIAPAASAYAYAVGSRVADASALAGGGLHGSGRAVLPVYGDQQSPAAGRSDDGPRRCRGERLAHARPETKVWVS